MTAAALVPFTPTASDPAVLNRRTVGRAELLDQLLDGAHAAARGLNRPHTLLVAPRGGGKTHLLAVFVHRLKTEAELAQALHVVVVPEDAVEIGSYYDLLIAVIETLDAGEQVTAAHVLRREGKRAELERRVLELLGDRPLVLVVENLDRIFDELGAQGQQQLRGFVETSRAVMLVASTPILFHGVSRRSEPWFGSFAVEHLTPWSVQEGATFLERIAVERDDRELADLIASPRGMARLTAVDRLVGGLPRLWTILANCITVELLDELVPLVLATLEELVPYYQARLNELSPAERKLVVALCRAETLGGEGGRTVRELALAAGVGETAAPKVLRRLEEASWVRATKPAGTDQRGTWYELREPLLRYHVAYRREAGHPLALVVSFLRAWFSPAERRRHLVATAAGSVAESHLVESLRDTPSASDSLYADGEPSALLAGAREWFGATAGPTITVRSELTAIVAEAVALVALGASGAQTTLAARLQRVDPARRAQVEHVAKTAIEAATAQGAAPFLRQQQLVVLAGLEAAMDAAAEARLEDQIAIALIARGWRGATGDMAGAHRGLADLLTRSEALPESAVALRLAVQGEVAFFGCETEQPGAFELMQRVLAERQRVLGADHPDTLTSRSNYAAEVGRRGRRAEARDLYAELARDRERILGPDHPDTLTSRQSHAYRTGQVGDHRVARDLYAELVRDRERVLGADHPDTLRSRFMHAFETGQAGDPFTARELHLALIADRERVLGADHPETLSSRHGHAYETGHTGEHATARDLHTALIADRERVLGADHPDTLSSRHGHAYETGRSGEHATARDLHTALVADHERVLGPEHPDTLTCRHNLAYETGHAGDHAAARDLYVALIADRERVLGADHPDTLASRHNHAYETGQAGDHAAARDLYPAVIADRARVLGADHPSTLTSRHNFAYETGQAGDHAAARDLYPAVIADRERVLGADHPDTLTSRHSHACETGLAGDHAAARDLHRPVVADRVRVLGPDHPDTLNSRLSHAYETGQAGDHAAARDMHAAVIADRERLVGPDHPDTLAVRHSHAYETGQAGDPAAARDLFTALVADRERVLGADAPDTLASRHSHAYYTYRAGDSAAAEALFAAVAADRERVLGAGHAATWSSKAMALWCMRSATARAEAVLELLAGPVPDSARSDLRLVLDHGLAQGDAQLLSRDQRRAVFHELLSVPSGRGLLSMLGASDELGELATELTASVAGDIHRESMLLAGLLQVAGARTWRRAELTSWLETWRSAFSAADEVAHDMLDAMQREADGDATARPSLTPELREILPVLRMVDEP